ncbi:uncharacterized protein RSE6_11114 [Rhynchosporium secalis]|uniref:Ubiquitin-like domain-containing protein n=1 Tax=Rhynchosporium secalis TaxID=38038 RepID=A0A1E1MM67_RHYSE|nr:uncharacterized protein RSE6_11114 [Rhynchosporium secalis]
MATTNQLWVNLGRPLPELNTHKCLLVHQGNDEEALKIKFKRTIRVVTGGWYYLRAASRRRQFPSVQYCSLEGNPSRGYDAQGWLLHSYSPERGSVDQLPFYRTIRHQGLLGGINAISEQHPDYAVNDPKRTGQMWLDGIAKQNGAVMHFVSVTFGSGYSVEAQVASTEKLSKGPLLVMVHSNASVYEFMREISKENKVPVDQMRLLYNSRCLEKSHLLSHYGIPDKSTVNLVLNIQGRGLLSGSNPADAEKSVGAGDLIKQSILRDPHAAIARNGDSTAIFNIQLLKATNFRRVTGTCAPSSPITASHRTGITGIFSDIQSVREIDIERGVQNSGPVKSKGKGLAKELEFPIIKPDKSGRWPKFVAVYQMESKSMGWGNAQLF